MGRSHRCSAEEGTSAPLLPETAEEVWNEPQHPQILLLLHVESILTGCITAWFGNSTAGNRKALQRVMRTARHIAGAYCIMLPSLQDIYSRRCTRKARRIIKDSSHPSHRLLSLLPSGRRLRSIRSRTSRLRDSFFSSGYQSNEQSEIIHPYSTLPLYGMPCTALLLHSSTGLDAQAHTALHFNFYTVQLYYTHTLHKYKKSGGCNAHP